MNSPAHAVFSELRKGRPLPADTTGLWSFPALVATKTQSLCWLCLVLPTVAMRAKKRTALFRPRAVVMTRANTLRLVHYNDFRVAHDPFPTLTWDKPVAMYPHRAIAGMTYRELELAEKALLAGYKDAGAMFLAEGALSNEFREQYLRLSHPVFLGYLKHLAPAFVTALAPSQPA